jgi:GTPase SAR1 family protein
MLTKYIKGEFTDQYNVTVGVEFTSKTIMVDEKLQVKLQIWDTVTTALLRPDRKPSEPSCAPSTKESAASSSPSASTARKASTTSRAGSERLAKMPTSRPSSS